MLKQKYKKMKYNDTIGAIIIGILLTVIVIMSFNKCGDSNSVEIDAIKKIDLKPELIRKDSFRTVIKYHDSTRIKTVIRHRELVKTILKDSTKCYSEIIYVSESCEGVIAKDSILIENLKQQHSNDTVIQVKLFKILDQKTDSIKTLSKKLKRQKLKTKGIIALWVIREAVGVGSKINN